MDPTFKLAGAPRISTRPDSSNRKYHIRVLNDLLFYSIQRRDLSRARRAWSILARCPEVDWKEMWRIGLLLVVDMQGTPLDEHDEAATRKDRVDYLKVVMLRHPSNRESILQELVLEFISQERYREALDELELYLPSFPYQDNPVLHLYAGLLSLYLSQPPANQMLEARGSEPQKLAKVDFSGFSKAQLQTAQLHFERAKSLDSNNVVASSYLSLIKESLEGNNAVHSLVRMDDSERNKSYSFDTNKGLGSDEMDDESLRSRKRLNAG